MRSRLKGIGEEARTAAVARMQTAWHGMASLQKLKMWQQKLKKRDHKKITS
jgi:hypothetical protein